MVPNEHPYLFLAVFMVVAVVFALVPLALARLWAVKFSPQKNGTQKNATYECGLESKGTAAIRLYEAGNVFLGRNPAGRHPRPVPEGDVASGAAGGDAYAREAARVAAVLAGPNGAGAFDRKEVETDFYDIKGVVEDILGRIAYGVYS